MQSLKYGSQNYEINGKSLNYEINEKSLNYGCYNYETIITKCQNYEINEKVKIMR